MRVEVAVTPSTDVLFWVILAVIWWFGLVFIAIKVMGGHKLLSAKIAFELLCTIICTVLLFYAKQRGLFD